MTRRLLGYVVKLPSGEWHDGKSYTDKDFDGYPWTKDAKKIHVFTEYQDACRYVLTYVPENLLRIVPVFSKPKPAEPEPAPLPPNPPCFCCGVGVEPGPRDDGFTDGERVACGHCGATNYPTVADDGTVEMSDGAEDEGDELKPAPVVAAEGLIPGAAGEYACLSIFNGGRGEAFATRFDSKPPRITTSTGTRAQMKRAARANGEGSSTYHIVRILPDGAHEAALAAAREEGRREVLAETEHVRELLSDAREARTLRDIFERHGETKKARHERGRLAKLVDELLNATGKGAAK